MNFTVVLCSVPHENIFLTFSVLIPTFPPLGLLSFTASVTKHVLIDSVIVLMVQTGKARGTFQIPCLKVPAVKKRVRKDHRKDPGWGVRGGTKT